jgi:hypothetical protein
MPNFVVCQLLLQEQAAQKSQNWAFKRLCGVHQKVQQKLQIRGLRKAKADLRITRVLLLKPENSRAQSSHTDDQVRG